MAARFLLTLPSGGELRLGERVLVMGILNVTPDSFSDGGDHLDPRAALAAARRMVAEGADLIDVGGESTRPGARAVSPEAEIERVIPVIRVLFRELSVPLSVDTRRGRVAAAALQAGAAIVNDVSGLADPETARVAAAAGAPVVLMHMRGTPADMARHTAYGDLLAEVSSELGAGIERGVAAGVPREQIVLDPGIGFAKTADQSFQLLRELPRLAELGHPLLVGPSRKSFLNLVADVSPKERLAATIGAVLAAAANGAHLVRVHDVAENVRALRTFERSR